VTRNVSARKGDDPAISPAMFFNVSFLLWKGGYCFNHRSSFLTVAKDSQALEHEER
jgi:hypothetical protein